MCVIKLFSLFFSKGGFDEPAVLVHHVLYCITYYAQVNKEWFWMAIRCRWGFFVVVSCLFSVSLGFIFDSYCIAWQSVWNHFGGGCANSLRNPSASSAWTFPKFAKNFQIAKQKFDGKIFMMCKYIYVMVAFCFCSEMVLNNITFHSQIPHR